MHPLSLVARATDRDYGPVRFVTVLIREHPINLRTSASTYSFGCDERREGTLKPSTVPGRWSSVFLVLSAIGLGGLLLSAASGQTGGEQFSDNWWLARPAFLAFACAVGSFIRGLFAIARGERSAVVMVAVTVGAAATFFTAGELLVPH